jgi:hypothetical protein
MATKKILLNESEMPTHWYNVVADMPNQLLPSLHPVTRGPHRVVPNAHHHAGGNNRTLYRNTGSGKRLL